MVVSEDKVMRKEMIILTKKLRIHLKIYGFGLVSTYSAKSSILFNQDFSLV